MEPVPNPFDEPLFRARASTGLQVVLHHRPRHAQTFAALGTNFGSVDRVGGADGQPVPEGLAHFLEHKLFEDRDGDVSDRFAGLGASTNAMTGFVGTSYVFSTVEQPLACLDLLLDFVQDPWFTDELVAKEQGIIAQEIRMYDDDPDWRLFFGVLQCLYRHHPVRDNIAGTVESIGQIDAAVLRACYEMFYHPTNMCLAVAGPVDPDALLGLVECDQAPRGADQRPPHRRRPEGEPARAVAPRFDLGMPVARPRWLMGIKETVLGGDGPGVLRRELATRILLDALLGRSSAAFEALYADGLVDESFGCNHTAEADFGFTTIGGDTDDPERLETRVREVFAAASRGGLDASALRRVRRRVRGAMLRHLDSAEHVAHGLLTAMFRGIEPFAALELLDAIDGDVLARRLEEHVRDEAIATGVVHPADGP